MDINLNPDAILSLRESINDLARWGIVNKKEEADLNESLNCLIKCEHYFITKPFRCCEAQSRTAYAFMRALSNRLPYIPPPEDPSEAEQT
jgi:hypothetical protein